MGCKRLELKQFSRSLSHCTGSIKIRMVFTGINLSFTGNPATWQNGHISHLISNRNTFLIQFWCSLIEKLSWTESCAVTCGDWFMTVVLYRRGNDILHTRSLSLKIKILILLWWFLVLSMNTFLNRIFTEF